jgi:hypothetical protein
MHAGSQTLSTSLSGALKCLQQCHFPPILKYRLLISESNNYNLQTISEVINVLKKNSIAFSHVLLYFLSYFTCHFISHCIPRIIYFHSRAMLDTELNSVLMENIRQPPLPTQIIRSQYTHTHTNKRLVTRCT